MGGSKEWKEEVREVKDKMEERERVGDDNECWVKKDTHRKVEEGRAEVIIEPVNH
jgi:hypothetical protein